MTCLSPGGALTKPEERAFRESVRDETAPSGAVDAQPAPPAALPEADTRGVDRLCERSGRHVARRSQNNEKSNDVLLFVLGIWIWERIHLGMKVKQTVNE